MPKRIAVLATPPRTRYLNDASSSFFPVPNPTRAYDAIDAISRKTYRLNKSPVMTTPFIPAIISMKSE